MPTHCSISGLATGMGKPEQTHSSQLYQSQVMTMVLMSLAFCRKKLKICKPSLVREHMQLKSQCLSFYCSQQQFLDIYIEGQTIILGQTFLTVYYSAWPCAVYSLKHSKPSPMDCALAAYIILPHTLYYLRAAGMLRRRL